MERRPGTTRPAPSGGPRRALWISGGLWVASWIVVYREIVHWHHLTPTLRLNPPPTVPGLPPPRPGLPLLAVRATAVAAPVVFVVASAARWGRPGRAAVGPHSPGGQQ